MTATHRGRVRGDSRAHCQRWWSCGVASRDGSGCTTETRSETSSLPISFPPSGLYECCLPGGIHREAAPGRVTLQKQARAAPQRPGEDEHLWEQRPGRSSWGAWVQGSATRGSGRRPRSLTPRGPHVFGCCKDTLLLSRFAARLGLGCFKEEAPGSGHRSSRSTAPAGACRMHARPCSCWMCGLGLAPPPEKPKTVSRQSVTETPSSAVTWQRFWGVQVRIGASGGRNWRAALVRSANLFCPRGWLC